MCKFVCVCMPVGMGVCMCVGGWVLLCGCYSLCALVEKNSISNKVTSNMFYVTDVITRFRISVSQ